MHTTGVMRRLDELARFSSEPDALTRLFLSPAHKAAAQQVLAWMRESGLTAALDAAGNVVGRIEGARPGLPAVILGSHIDTVRDAGKYDGAFGVVAAIEAVSRLRAAALPFAVEVAAFGDEEGVRFPATLIGSRALAGTLDPAALDARDAEGISVREALRRFGCDPAGLPVLARRQGDVLAYVEAHIEQGPVLEAEGLPLGVVTAIAGATRCTVEVDGMAGHAGTVPMPLRRDALCAAAGMILAVERAARETEGMVATVGRIEALPGAVNVIPGTARFTLDIRSADDAVRQAGVDAITATCRRIAAERHVELRMCHTYAEAAAPCAGPLVAALEAAVARAGIRPRQLPSGAGHDGLAMAALCPVGMLFVRCRGGVSHHPAEAIGEADAEIAVRVLADFLQNLDPGALAA